jgi:hypothetical protein
MMMVTQLPTSQQRPAGGEDTARVVVAATLCSHGATASHSSWSANDADPATVATIDYCLPSHGRSWPGHGHRL